MSDEIKSALASESAHWYTKQGEPCYEVPRAKGDGMRPTTLADARKLDLVPSVTTILQCAAKPGLEAWKARQILEAALTLPRHPTESLDDYATRVIEDSKAQGRKAAEKGTEYHAAIEAGIQGEQISSEHYFVFEKLVNTMTQYGINLSDGKAEHSFASPLGYGGKLDWHNDEIICDFKTKAIVKGVKQLAWPEHCYQLAAYDIGLTYPDRSRKNRRLINVFIGIQDNEIRIHEWSEKDAQQGWMAFQALLSFWQITKNWKQNP